MQMIQDHEQREAITWALCAEADGGGRGKCDPDHCACGPMSIGVIAALHHAGFAIVRVAHSAGKRDV